MVEVEAALVVAVVDDGVPDIVVVADYLMSIRIVCSFHNHME
jgi:hypothetical protein